MGIDPRLNNDGAEGLGHIVHGAQQQPPLLILLLRQAGQQDNRHMPGQLGAFQLPQDGKPVHIRHNDVQEDEGVAPLLGGLQALPGGIADGHIVVIL